ncbi:MAG: transporter [Hyphomicrobiaceae bacterium]
MLKTAIPLSMILSFTASSNGVLAADYDKRPAAGIQDNSFLIEEAYNQEAGVVQHINNFRRHGKDWFYTFTQEIPIGSQAHQFSYSVPYSWLKTDTGRDSGFGDLQFNYRYQLSMETTGRPAIAPRLSLIVPSGNDEKGLGVGSYGTQLNLPVSKIVTDRVTLHGNAGLTHYFDVHGEKPTSYLLGGSMVYAVHRNFNLMLEGIQEWTESVNDFGFIERERSFTLSPGARYALNFDGGTQVVLGAAVPIRFVEDKREYGAFFYLSIEHSIRSSAK